jgi:hypothetical protein
MRAYRVLSELDNTKQYDTMSVRVMAAIHGAALPAVGAAVQG